MNDVYINIYIVILEISDFATYQEDNLVFGIEQLMLGIGEAPKNPRRNQLNVYIPNSNK